MADIEMAVCVLLDALAYTDTTTPGNLEELVAEHGGVIRVRRVGGGGDSNNDFPRVSVQHFAKPDAAEPRAHFDLAAATEKVFNRLATYGPEMHGGLCIEVDAKDSGPVELFYENPAVRVTETIWRLTTRHPEE